MIEFGLLLPHFSDATSWDRLFGFAPRIEQLGYGSAWARDNLGFHGHGFELEGDFFLDPFTTLAGVAALTSTMRLGTAVLTPFRHPLVTAQLVGGLDFLSRGRFVLGVGPGTPRKPWEAVGRVYEERVAAAREMVQVLRLMSSGDVESYAGELTSFVDVKLDPPPPADLTVWYGGASNASVRAVVEYADGMLPGRCPFHRYDVAVERLRTAAAEAGTLTAARVDPHRERGRDARGGARSDPREGAPRNGERALETAVRDRRRHRRRARGRGSCGLCRSRSKPSSTAASSCWSSTYGCRCPSSRTPWRCSPPR